jgi:hypothetical protein
MFPGLVAGSVSGVLMGGSVAGVLELVKAPNKLVRKFPPPESSSAATAGEMHKLRTTSMVGTTRRRERIKDQPLGVEVSAETSGTSNVAKAGTMPGWSVVTILAPSKWASPA